MCGRLEALAVDVAGARGDLEDRPGERGPPLAEEHNVVPVVGEHRNRPAVADDLSREELPVVVEDEPLDIEDVAGRQLLGGGHLGRERHVS